MPYSTYNMPGYSNNMSCGCACSNNLKGKCGSNMNMYGYSQMMPSYMPYQYNYGYPYQGSMPYGRKDERFFPLIPFALGLAAGPLLFRPRPGCCPPMQSYNYSPYYYSNNYY